MAIAFFVSSVGDTDLAKATISTLLQGQNKPQIYLIPLTVAALNRTQDVAEGSNICRISLAQITEQESDIDSKQISPESLAKVQNYIKQKNIQHAYVGVPSPIDEQIPFQIAKNLEIPFTVAYEFMFKPNTHSFWDYASRLASKENCDFAVPLPAAGEDILALDAKAKIHTIGHLSIDRALITSPSVNVQVIKENLHVSDSEKLTFISGTTQPIEVDDQFLEALLQEIATGQYPKIQLRFGLHPGVKNLDTYLNTLLRTCEKYPAALTQFKFILPMALAKRLKEGFDSPWIIRAEVSGSDAAQAADQVMQAVPGALLNEAALQGKQSYYHDKSVKPYLNSNWFANNLSELFSEDAGVKHEREELGLTDTAPNLCAKLII